MKRFVEGENRQQMILLPDCLDDYVVEDNPVRVIDVFIDELDLTALGFEGATLLKIYLYGYLNRIPSSRRLRRPWLLCTVDATGEPSGSRSHRVPTARRD